MNSDVRREIASATSAGTTSILRPSPYGKREIIQGANDAKTYARPMPANARAILIEALRDAHHWLDELLTSERRCRRSITPSPIMPR